MKTRGQRNPRTAQAGPAELVFVIDVSALTEGGFVGTSAYEGEKVELEFDDAGKGVRLTAEMAGRLRVRKGSKVSLALEDGSSEVVGLTVSGIGKAPAISDPKVYHAVGREGGAVVRIRKA